MFRWKIGDSAKSFSWLFFITALSTNPLVGYAVPPGEEGLQAGTIEESDESRRVHLRATIENRDDSSVLVIVLRNGGAIPVTVDRELVFCVYVLPLKVDGTTALPKRGRVVDRPKISERKWRERFVKLQPGKSIVRRIELSRGVKAFHAPTLLLADAIHAPSPAYECVESIDLDKDVVELRVHYTVPSVFPLAFHQYTGLDTEALNLLMGPLAPASVKLDEALRDSRGTRPCVPEHPKE